MENNEQKLITFLEKTYIRTNTNIVLCNEKEVIYAISDSCTELLHSKISKELKNIKDNQNKIIPIIENDKNNYEEQIIYEIKKENKTKYTLIFYTTNKKIDRNNIWIFEATKRILSKHLILEEPF